MLSAHSKPPASTTNQANAAQNQKTLISPQLIHDSNVTPNGPDTKETDSSRFTIVDECLSSTLSYFIVGDWLIISRIAEASNAMLSPRVNTALSFAVTTSNAIVRAHQINSFTEHTSFFSSTPAIAILHSLSAISSLAELSYTFNENLHIQDHNDLITTIRTNSNYKCVFIDLVALLSALGVGAAHGFLFYLSCEDLFGGGTENAPGELRIVATILAILLTITGSIEEMLLGGISFIKGSHKNQQLFHTSKQKDSLYRTIEEVLVNSPLLLAATGEFALLYGELIQHFPDHRNLWISVLSLVNTTMYLSHECELLLTTLKNLDNFYISWKKIDEERIMIVFNILNGAFHGLARYTMLNHLLSSFCSPNLAFIMGVVSSATIGLSRTVALTCSNIDNHNTKQIPLEKTGYSAAQCYEDLVYETSLAILMLFIPDNYRYLVNPVAGIASESIIFCESTRNWQFKNTLITFASLILGALAAEGFAKVFDPGNDSIHYFTTSVITTVLTRHFTHKAIQSYQSTLKMKEEKKPAVTPQSSQSKSNNQSAAELGDQDQAPKLFPDEETPLTPPRRNQPPAYSEQNHSSHNNHKPERWNICKSIFNFFNCRYRSNDSQSAADNKSDRPYSYHGV